MIINKREINVVVERKRIKNIYFRIDDETGDLNVSCPLRCSDREINKLIESNIKSLEKMYKRYERRSKDGETLWFPDGIGYGDRYRNRFRHLL